MRACATFRVVAWHRTLRKALHLHSFSAPPSCALLGPNLPDVWVPKESTPPHTHFPESFQWVNGHSAAILEGKPIAKHIKLEVADEVRRMKSGIRKCPRLAVVLVGRDSHTFIHIKLKACDQVRIETVVSQLPEKCTENELLDVVSSFSDDPDVHGIVVQLPLPQGYQLPCYCSVLDAYTKNPEEITSKADIVVADVGIPNIVRDNWLKKGAVVIDMGTNQVKDLSRQGFRVAGDVCFEEAVKVASAITPVPGGVGPVTISMLLSNNLDSAKCAFGMF